MNRKFGIIALILILCLAFGCGNDTTPPSPENFNIVELRSDGVTFETNHAVNSSYLSNYIDWKVYLSLYDASSDALIAEELISQYTPKPRINYETFNVVPQTFFLKERGEKGGDKKTSGVSDAISLTLPQTISVGTQPGALAINESNNCVYVTNWYSNNVTKISLGETTTTTTIETGYNPYAVAVNSSLDKVYVANSGSNTVSIINGENGNRTDVNVDIFPCALTYNPVTNRIYVVNNGTASVSVIDGSTDQVLPTIAVGNSPLALAVNSITNTIYVANRTGNSITKIDGTTNSTTEISVGTAPIAIAVNEQTNKVYVANNGSSNVTVVDGATNEISTIAVGEYPRSIAVNTLTNKIYVANRDSNTVSVIDGGTQFVNNIAVGIPANTDGNYYPVIEAKAPYYITIDDARNKIYVANIASSNVTVIDGANNNRIFIMKSTGCVSRAIAVNATTGEVFTVNAVSREFDGNGNVMRSFPVTRTPHE